MARHSTPQCGLRRGLMRWPCTRPALWLMSAASTRTNVEVPGRQHRHLTVPPDRFIDDAIRHIVYCATRFSWLRREVTRQSQTQVIKAQETFQLPTQRPAPSKASSLLLRRAATKRTMSRTMSSQNPPLPKPWLPTSPRNSTRTTRVPNRPCAYRSMSVRSSVTSAAGEAPGHFLRTSWASKICNHRGREDGLQDVGRQSPP
ncbi:hypothetical protein B0T11DRAFT_29260 [Plectosphaerella cucumerina]|uniref:Uncharacterized protein n=1 Tax=Plectosphaerella cucumerina TaxID=40658 RepID=A0A8K0TWL2_9PEZI|nr:hypothetical protein B0T11DRAFT_29260 [Plectosphaerella cucumerina]